MKVYGADGAELMEISHIERSGNNLVLKGKIMGSLPMKAVIKPAEARKGLALMGLRTFLFLPSLLFRRSKSKS
jgi:hypothetical protein